MMSSSSTTTTTTPTTQGGLSTPGPKRTTPRNRQFSQQAQSTPSIANSTARAISNARREAAAVGVSKTRKGWVESIASFLGPVKRTIQGTLFGMSATTTDGKSLWQYISTTTWNYLGFAPKRQFQSMLDEQLWIDHREKERAERDERIRQLEERRRAREQQRQDELAAQVLELGKSMDDLVNNAARENGRQWVEQLGNGLHPHHKFMARLPNGLPAEKKEEKTDASSEDKENSTMADQAPIESAFPAQPSRQSFKDQFQANFKSDPSKDKEKIAFIKEYTGWSLPYLQRQFEIFQRFPNLKNEYDLNREDHPEKLAQLAEILSDRGFLKRNHIHSTKLSFEPVWGRKVFQEKHTIDALRKVYIPFSQLEPAPSYRPREFSTEERLELKKTDYRDVINEFRKQTIYDLEFHTPSDGPLPLYEQEIRNVDFEVSRDDPRLRQLWKLLPSVRLSRPVASLERNAESRLAYKLLISKRDKWYWQLSREIEKRDRSLAKVYSHFDLNRKRNEISWNEYPKVYLVQTDDPVLLAQSAQKAQIDQQMQASSQDDVISQQQQQSSLQSKKPRDEGIQQRRLPGHTVSHSYLPYARAKHLEKRTGPVPRLADAKPFVPYNNTNASVNAWVNKEADLSDEDNFPSRDPHANFFSYSESPAGMQGRRLATALAKDKAKNKGVFGKSNRKEKKKVTFADGHIETIFRPYEAEVSSRSASPEEMRVAKKRRSTNGEGVSEPETEASRNRIRKAAIPVQNLHAAVPTLKKSRVPNTLTRPANIGQGSSNPLKRGYQASLAEFPREWRSLPGCFSAWEEDAEDAGIFYEMDIKNGKLPKGVGTWEIELEQTRQPKRIRIMRDNGSEQDFAVWGLDGTLKPVEWTPPDMITEESETETETEAVDDETPTKKPVKSVNTKPVDQAPKAAANIAAAAETSKPRPDQLPDLSDTLRGFVKPKTLEEEHDDFFKTAAVENDTEEAEMTDFQRNYQLYLRELELEKKQKEKKEAALRNLKATAPPRFGGSDLENSPFDGAGNTRPRKSRRSVDLAPVEIDPSFPIFNPFDTQSDLPRAGLSRSSSKSEGALPSPPLSNDDENSGKEDNVPGSKAKARLTGLFDPVQSQKTPFTVVEDTTAHETSKPVEKPVAESFQSEVTAPSSQGSEPATEANVLQPVVNDATLPRLGSSSDLSKTQVLLPPAQITTTTPVTPSAPITAAEIGMFGAVKPSPNDRRGLDDDSGMDIDNTPQSAKKIRSPKELGLVANASTSMAESFKPSIPASFDFGSMSSKPLFGGNNNAIVANASSEAPYVFGGPATAKPVTTGDNPFLFGGPTAAPPVFGASKPAAPSAQDPFGFGASKPAEKAADAPFVFGGKATAAPVSTGIFGGASAAPSLFGTSTTAAAPSIFGASTAAPSMFGASTAATAAPSIFGASAAATAAPSIFGVSAAGPSAPTLFGATATNPPTSSGLFGAVSGVTAAPSFGSAAPTSSASLFGTQTTTAPTSQSFGFGAPTTSAPIFGGNNAATSSASFTYGSTATSQPMQFGGELTKPTAASFTSGISFGSGANSPAPSGNFNFGAASPAPSTSGPPLFGASTPSTPLPQAGASFGADPNNPFGFQPQQTNTLGRNIKAAVSRKPGSVRGRR
ncbi:hypothetical protein ABW20_dc0106360 [Dactylellina cionopaga]|nr:hypothetical protein ABW20_dc0106360 [Dactylellina cionopaga]